jgi:hypothetical protein
MHGDEVHARSDEAVTARFSIIVEQTRHARAPDSSTPGPGPPSSTVLIDIWPKIDVTSAEFCH